MRTHTQHIILVGFKHVGKSVIGRLLAKRMQKTYLDLDHEIERFYQDTYHKKCSCREIVKNKGEPFFRDMEQKALQQIIAYLPCVIATGGGTPMRTENCHLMAPHCIIHLTEKPKHVFNRIMRKGRPAFFPADENPWNTFYRLWKIREKVYKRIATFTVENHNSIHSTVEKIMEKIL
jgi:shikimate kinase